MSTGGFAIIIACSALAGCTNSRETAREEATVSVRTKAESVRSEIAAAANGTSGGPQLEAVRAVLPDVPLVAAADGDGVIVTGAMTATAEAGGGLSYESFSARLCLQYRITAGSGETKIADAPCTARVDALAQADETVALND